MKGKQRLCGNLKYRPLSAWIRRMYRQEHVAKALRTWHERRSSDGVMRDVIDGEAFQWFLEAFPQ